MIEAATQAQIRKLEKELTLATDRWVVQDTFWKNEKRRWEQERAALLQKQCQLDAGLKHSETMLDKAREELKQLKDWRNEMKRVHRSQMDLITQQWEDRCTALGKQVDEYANRNTELERNIRIAMEGKIDS